jgi:hypothetical protein
MTENDMTEEKRGPGRPPKKETFACRVLRDYWDAEGNRITAGSVVDLTAAEAMDAVETGAVSRVK